jgi:hypothetical protein
VEDVGQSAPAEDLAGPIVEALLDGAAMGCAVLGQLGAVGKQWRGRSLILSFVPRCQGRPGCAKNTPSRSSGAICWW